jgi:dienelactone hydrolase
MTGRKRRRTTALKAFVTCGLVIVGSGASSPGAAAARSAAATAHPAPGMPSGGVGLSIPRPTGRDPVGVRSTFVHDPARTEPLTGEPRAIPVRVWYPSKHRRAPSAPYFSAPVQSAIEQGIGAPTGLFDVDTHASLDTPARRHVRGVLLFTGGFAVPVAFYTGLITELASRGYAVVAFDHPHETFVVEQPDGSLILRDLVRDDAAFDARLRDIEVVLDALEDLVPESMTHTPIGILGHSDGGKAAGVAISRHPQIRAGANLDGMIAAELITAGLDRPFGLMLGLDATPEELSDIETFLSNMRAPYAVRTLEIHHYGFSDFVVFNPQAQGADPALGTALEATFFTGTLESLRAGQRALTEQRRFLVRFFDRYLRGADARADRPRPSRSARARAGARGRPSATPPASRRGARRAGRRA